MNNITQFVFMLHGFAKFNEIQPNIKQWNKIQDEYLKMTFIESTNEVDISIVSTTFQDLINTINNVEQVPTAAQWRDIKTIVEEIINQLRMEIDLDDFYASCMDDDDDNINNYEIEDNFLPEDHYESRLCVSASEIKINPSVYSSDTNIPFTFSTLNDKNLSCDVRWAGEEINIIDNFIANSYKQKSFEF